MISVQNKSAVNIYYVRLVDLAQVAQLAQRERVSDLAGYWLLLLIHYCLM